MTIRQLGYFPRFLHPEGTRSQTLETLSLKIEHWATYSPPPHNRHKFFRPNGSEIHFYCPPRTPIPARIRGRGPESYVPQKPVRHTVRIVDKQKYYDLILTSRQYVVRNCKLHITVYFVLCQSHQIIDRPTSHHLLDHGRSRMSYG